MEMLPLRGPKVQSTSGRKALLLSMQLVSKPHLTETLEQYLTVTQLGIDQDPTPPIYLPAK